MLVHRWLGFRAQLGFHTCNSSFSGMRGTAQSCRFITLLASSIHALVEGELTHAVRLPVQQDLTALYMQLRQWPSYPAPLPGSEMGCF